MRLRMIGLALSALALASSAPAPEILPHKVVDRPERRIISLTFDAVDEKPVCMIEDWVLTGGPGGGPVVLEVAGKRYPLKSGAVGRCERDCVVRLVKGYAQNTHIPYDAFDLPEALDEAPKTVDATLVASSCEGTKPLREESYKATEWMPLGSSEQQICKVFGEVTRWENRDRIRNARQAGESPRRVPDYDRQQLPGGAIFDYYLSRPDAEMADPKEFSRDFRFYILGERGRVAGAPRLEQMRDFLISALPPASEIRDFGGEGESVRFKQSNAFGVYMPAMCRMQDLCRPHGVVRTTHKLPCGDIQELPR
ncbi:hypothetical protein [Caulobacter endophyticus]|uniref:hypothetical protein n=1 Tax=Caulobacter endophyticus TaxID=2172652 RepID=UPI00240F316D|nr:hypothetical protein [Caulobacter endophyticus]MDG2528350.1 hypothetical protein [Caulobacter endophyticus]